MVIAFWNLKPQHFCDWSQFLKVKFQKNVMLWLPTMCIITSKFTAYHLSYIEEPKAWSPLTVTPLLHIEPDHWVGLDMCHFISQCSDRALPLSQSSSCRLVCGHYFPFFIRPLYLVKELGSHTLQDGTMQWKRTKHVMWCWDMAKARTFPTRAGRYLHPSIIVGKAGRLPASELTFSLHPF